MPTESEAHMLEQIGYDSDMFCYVASQHEITSLAGVYFQLRRHGVLDEISTKMSPAIGA